MPETGIQNAAMDAEPAMKRAKEEAMPQAPAETKLFCKKLSENATLPKKGSAQAAGFDLFAAEDSVIAAGGKGIAKTNIAIKMPRGYYGRVAPRSGLAWKKHLDVGAGVIDEDYRGDVGVVLFNHAKEDFEVKKGDRVAQLILEKYAVEVDEVEEVNELDETDRGAGGFGSTGVSNKI